MDSKGPDSANWPPENLETGGAQVDATTKLPHGAANSGCCGKTARRRALATPSNSHHRSGLADVCAPKRVEGANEEAVRISV